MTRSSNYRHRGWALPATLFAIAVALSTIRVLSIESVDTSRIAREIHNATQLQATIATTVRTSSSTAVGCERVTVSHETIEVPFEVCRERVRAFTTVPPSVSLPPLLIDYDSLFSRASVCPALPTPTKLLDVASPRAALDCTLPSVPRGSIILLENVTGDSISLSQTETTQLVLATPGRIVISQELRTSQDLLVVAGGDVRIASIQTAPATNVTVTIVSSLGRIEIGTAGSSVSLLAAGRGEITAPPTTASLSYPLPPFRVPSVYSFRPAN